MTINRKAICRVVFLAGAHIRCRLGEMTKWLAARRCIWQEHHSKRCELEGQHNARRGGEGGVSPIRCKG
jgi:hypothetical protein